MVLQKDSKSWHFFLGSVTCRIPIEVGKKWNIKNICINLKYVTVVEYIDKFDSLKKISTQVKIVRYCVLPFFILFINCNIAQHLGYGNRKVSMGLNNNPNMNYAHLVLLVDIAEMLAKQGLSPGISFSKSDWDTHQVI